MNPEKILITGASGQLGSRLAKALGDIGHNIYGMDIRLPKTSLYSSTAIKSITADITRPKTFPTIIKESTILVHCATLATRWYKNPPDKEFFRININGTANILKAIDRAKLKRIIFLSSVSVFGLSGRHGVTDESTPPEPVDAYGESKLLAEEEIITAARNEGIPYTIFRLAPVYDIDLLGNIRKRIYLPANLGFYKIGNGEQRISLCGAGNVIGTIIQLLERSLDDKKMEGIFILKDRPDYSINEIMAAMRRFHMHKHRPIITVPEGTAKTVSKILDSLKIKGASALVLQLAKISDDARYSCEKILATGIDLPFELRRILFGSKAK